LSKGRRETERKKPSTAKKIEEEKGPKNSFQKEGTERSTKRNSAKREVQHEGKKKIV